MYNEAVRGLYERFPSMPAVARPFVREYGRACLDLHRNAPALDRALEKNRLTEARRLRREAKVLRFMLLKLQGQIERLAGVAPVAVDPMEALIREEEGEE